MEVISDIFDHFLLLETISSFDFQDITLLFSVYLSDCSFSVLVAVLLYVSGF